MFKIIIIKKKKKASDIQSGFQGPGGGDVEYVLNMNLQENLKQHRGSELGPTTTGCSCRFNPLLSQSKPDFPAPPPSSSSLDIPPECSCNILCHCKIWAEKCAVLQGMSGLEGREEEAELHLGSRDGRELKKSGRYQLLAPFISPKTSLAATQSKG